MSKEDNKRVVVGVCLCYFLVFSLIFIITRALPLFFTSIGLLGYVINQSLPAFYTLILLLACLFVFSIKLKIYSRKQNHSLIFMVSGALLAISAVVSISISSSSTVPMAIEIFRNISSTNNKSGSDLLLGTIYANISVVVGYFIQVLIGISMIFVARIKERNIRSKDDSIKEL